MHVNRIYAARPHGARVARLAGLLLWAAGSLAGCERFVAEPELDVYWDAPAFSLTDQTGATLTDADLRGKVWAADFFFTSCPAICPILTASLGRVQAALADHAAAHPDTADDARLVSFSLQPEVDTPETLAAYGREHGVDPDRWRLLTGDRDTLWRLSENGFRLAVTATPQVPGNPIGHDGRIALVDRDGRVRGYYNGLEADQVDRLIADFRRLLDAG